MFFYLSKLLAFLISPLVWVMALLLASFFTSLPQRARRLRIAGVLLLYLSCNPFLVDECFRQWEPVTEDHDLLDTRYEAAIVLGGIGNIDLRLEKINFGHASDRLFQVLPLVRNGRVGKLVFTGGSGSIEFPEKREALFVQKYLRSIGFPDSLLVIEPDSRNTYENAVNTKRILDSLGLHGRFLLVTSAFHMPRSIAVFRKAGYTDIQPYITNKISGVRRFTPDHLLVPDFGAGLGLHLLLHEWVGLLTYKLKGYA